MEPQPEEDPYKKTRKNGKLLWKSKSSEIVTMVNTVPSDKHIQHVETLAKKSPYYIVYYLDKLKNPWPSQRNKSEYSIKKFQLGEDAKVGEKLKYFPKQDPVDKYLKNQGW